MLEDGRVFVNGGIRRDPVSTFLTSTFDYRTNNWTQIESMAAGRWYPNTVALPNGQVFTAAGTPGSDYAEIWTEGLGWEYLSGVNILSAILNFPTWTEPSSWLPHFHLAPNGKIFHSGHTPEMHFIDPSDSGSIKTVDISNDWNTANIPGVLYEEGKLLKAGGALYDANNTGTGKAAIIDINTDIPTKTPTNPMQYPRIFHNQVVLPNGELMVIGGNTTGLKFNDNFSQFTPEIWNPSTQKWRTVADIAAPRNYHSVALLMTDGRVWSGGGGICKCIADHPDSQVFSPPYLFNPDGTPAVRPEIFSAPDIIANGLQAFVTTSPDVEKFTMVRMSATTHAVNSDMRFLNVPFSKNQPGNFVLNFHPNRNVLTPGYWMLFALNSQGVPSIAKVVQVTTDQTPFLQNPSDQNTFKGTKVELLIKARSTSGAALSYSALGLPAGLTIDPITGLISGNVSTEGSYRVVVSVRYAGGTASTTFIWRVLAEHLNLVSDMFGNGTGVSFADQPTRDQTLFAVRILRDKSVNAIQGITNYGPFSKHGGNSGLATRETWANNEYLVRIFGISGSQVCKINLVTNTGRIIGPFGDASDCINPENFDYSVPINHEIVGFTGRATATSLTAIGVIYRERQNTNQPPWPTSIADQHGQTETAVELQVNATDAEGDKLTYSSEGLPSGLSIDSQSGLISGTPLIKGEYDVIVTVKDDKNAVSAVSFHWQIKGAIRIAPINTFPQTINADITFVTNISNARNPHFQWSFGDGTPQTTPTDSISITHRYKKPGLYIVTLKVTDDSGDVANKSFTQAIHLPLTAQRPVLSSNIVTATVLGKPKIWVVNHDNDSVSVFDTSNYAKLAEISVGSSPSYLAVAPNGQIWVSNTLSSTLSVIDPATLAIVKTIRLPFASQPAGVVFAPDQQAAYVVLEATGQLIKLNPTTGGLLATVSIGNHPKHLAVQSDSKQIFVSHFITPPLPDESTANVKTAVNGVNVGGEISVIDANSMTLSTHIILKYSRKQDTEFQGSGIPNYLAAMAISPDGQSAWLPSKQDNIKRGTLRNGQNLNFSNTVRAIGSKIDVANLREDYPARLDFDNAGVASAAVFDRSGNYLFVALETSREVAIVDAYGGREIRRMSVGHAPNGLAVSEDGKTLYVHNFMDRTVSVVDLTTLLSQGDARLPILAVMSSVNTEKLSPAVLKGKQLFYDAQDPRLATDNYLSCAACHNNGEGDGRVWDLTGFGEGLRNTIDLRGRAGMAMGPLHWTGNFDEIQDFESQIRNLAGGTGLLADADFAKTQNPLGVPKAGLNADLDALAAFVSSLKTMAPSPWRHPNGSLSSSALAGKSVFNTAGCSQCHGGKQFSDSPSRLAHDIGTIKPSSGKRLDKDLAALYVPTLRDVWNTAPYLHDGSAKTLEDAVMAHKNLSLTNGDTSQLVAYLLEIGSVEPAPANIATNVTLTQPANGSLFKQGDNLVLTADAIDADSRVTKVEFYSGNKLLGSDSDAPYSFNWNNLPFGRYSLRAKAYDNYGVAKFSSFTAISVGK